MRTRLTGTLALLAILFSALFVIGSSNAGAQEIREVDQPVAEEDDTIGVCKLEGLDWVLYEFDASGAEYWLNNGGVLAGADGCFVRVCEVKTGQAFTYWSSHFASPSDAAWTIGSADAYIAAAGVACPGNDPVTICVQTADGYAVETMAPDAAEWLLYTGQGSLLVDGACKVPEEEPTPTPEEEPTPTPEEEPTPEPEDEPTPTPEPEEEPEDEQPTPTPEPEEEPEDEDEPEKKDETSIPPAPQPTPNGTQDAEVLGKQEVRELAFTGAESSDLALYGVLALATGTGLVLISRRRMAAIEA